MLPPLKITNEKHVIQEGNIVLAHFPFKSTPFPQIAINS